MAKIYRKNKCSNFLTNIWKAISCHYASGDCHFIDVEDTSQNVIADEVLELVEKRIGSKSGIKFSVSVFRIRTHKYKTDLRQVRAP